MRISSHKFNIRCGWDQPLPLDLDSKNTLLLVFGPPAHEALAQGFDDLQVAFPTAIWAGCSTAGEIYGKEISDESLVIVAMCFDRCRVQIASDIIDDENMSGAIGRKLNLSLDAPDLKAILVFSDGTRANGSELVLGLSLEGRSSQIITGGLAADGSRFEHTWVLVGRVPTRGGVSAVGLYGEALGIAHASYGGWDTLGPERVVTRSRRNTLYSLDGQPALDLYKKYLGARSQGLPATALLFPLAIKNDDAEMTEVTVRTVLSVDEREQSITLAGNIPQGSIVQLMRGNSDRLIDGAGTAARGLILKPRNSEPIAVIAVSCVGRRLVLGQRADEEIELINEILPPPTKLVGYYSYGEISPLASGRCDLHNQTMTLTAYWEK